MLLFQSGIALAIPGKNIQAIIDWDTGLIGFTEANDNKVTELLYHEAPPAYRTALMSGLESQYSTERQVNMRISYKSEFYAAITAAMATVKKAD